MLTAADLRDRIAALDGRSYKAYRRIEGRYAFDDSELEIPRAQGDPFAAPTRIRARLLRQAAAFPPDLVSRRAREVALRDFLARRLADAARALSRSRGTGHSGRFHVDPPGQEILARTAVLWHEGEIEIRLTAGLPARGRRIVAQQAVHMLLHDLPRLIDAARYPSLEPEAVRQHLDTAEDAAALRQALRSRGLVAFVADDSCLPRRSGVDPQPLAAAVRFRSPESLRVAIHTPHRGEVSGMGIPAGTTLIAGGGYHGKSTLLQALALGIYDHVPGDGRELVVSDPDTVTIRAQDGRSVRGVDISAFIADLPGGRATGAFDTDNASGSTSQATAIAEALESGARLLLLDEDTCATNFMVRDRRMQQLTPHQYEPITPFLDRVRDLHMLHGISAILVMGGCGDYLDVADTVIGMRAFQAHDMTDEARRIARDFPTSREPEPIAAWPNPAARVPDPGSIDPSRGRRDVKVGTCGCHEIRFGRQQIDLSAVNQLAHESQLRGIVAALVWAREQVIDGRRSVRQILDEVERHVQRQGLPGLAPGIPGDLAAFRRHELAAALNRLRSLRLLAP